MLNGEECKRAIEALKEGKTQSAIAKELGATIKMIRKVEEKYKKYGDAIFHDPMLGRKKPKIGRVSVPSEERIQENIREHVHKEARFARELEKVRRTIKIGDKISIVTEEGQGFTKRRLERSITVEYIGKAYVKGKTEKGYPMTISIYDLAKMVEK